MTNKIDSALSLIPKDPVLSIERYEVHRLALSILTSQADRISIFLFRRGHRSDSLIAKVTEAHNGLVSVQKFLDSLCCRDHQANNPENSNPEPDHGYTSPEFPSDILERLSRVLSDSNTQENRLGQKDPIIADDLLCISLFYLSAHRSITEIMAEVSAGDSKGVLTFMLMPSLLEVGEAFLEAQNEYLLVLSSTNNREENNG